MADGIANLEAVIANLERAIEEARQVTREIHEATKEYRQAKAEAGAKADEIRVVAAERVDALMADAVSAGLEKYRDTIKTVTKQAHDNVGKQFDRLANLCLYGNEHGKGPNVFEEMRTTLNWYMAQFKEAPPLPNRPDLPRLK
jgi:hypothetical protein